MATGPSKPLLLLNLYLDQGERSLAGRTVTFKGLPFTARVISWGTLEKSIPVPSGQMEIGDAVLEVADTDGYVRTWFNSVTPLKRLGEIIFESESSAAGNPDLSAGNIALPIYNIQATAQPLSDPIHKPIYTGEIKDFRCEPGKVRIWLHDIVESWLARPIPKLLIRDNFRNLPDDVESGFIPIIFGRCVSDTSTGLEPQGVIKCQQCDTTLNRYVVARHTCYQVITVYRKRKGDARFFPVNSSEYSIVVQAMTINNIVYSMTFIQFNTQEVDGTLINADVSGANFRWDFSVTSQTSGEIRNPIDCLTNLIYLFLLDEVVPQSFDVNSFNDTRQRCDDKHYTCDGAITEELTVSAAISRLCSDFNIDFTQNNSGDIFVHMFDVELDANTTIPLDTNLILKKTLEPELPKKIFNRFRYRYARQNAGTSEYMKRSATGNWGYEETIDYVKDQTELSANGINPLLEEIVELHFVRDDNVAMNVVKRRMGYHTLRSYMAEFQLPAPPSLYSIVLSQSVTVTHFGGIDTGGWSGFLMKVYGLTIDLKDYSMRVRAIAFAHISDADLLFSFNGTHPAHDVQVRKPYLPASVENTPAPSAAPRINLNKSLPAPPASQTVTDGGQGLGFTSNGTVLNGMTYSYVNIIFQEDDNDPRNVSAYVPNLAPLALGAAGPTLILGTLSPDTRPTGLTNSDAGRIRFYAQDFDTEYLWVGSSGNPLGFTSNPPSSGWLAINWHNHHVCMFDTAPTSVGWHICDGSTVIQSTIGGTTESVTLPNLTGGVYPKLGLAYTGPNPTAAVAPTISGSTQSATSAGTLSGGATGPESNSHTHLAQGGSTTGSPFTGGGSPWGVTGKVTGVLPAHTHDNEATAVLPTHVHDVTGLGTGYEEVPAGGSPLTPAGTISLPDHYHTFASDEATQNPLSLPPIQGTAVVGSIGGITSAPMVIYPGELAHDHTIITEIVPIVGDGSDVASFTESPTLGALESFSAALPDHSHSGGAVDMGATSLPNHLHGLGEITTAGVHGLPISISFEGDGLPNHFHFLNPATTGPSSGAPVTITIVGGGIHGEVPAEDLTFQDTSPNHHHTVDSETLTMGNETATHTHSIVGIGVNIDPHSHNLNSSGAPISTTGEPLHMGLLPYTRL